MAKIKIPRALREQLWLTKVGRHFETKCFTNWCKNKITVFDFQCGHDIPESKGGATTLQNLVPICIRCNLSMSNVYTFKEWDTMTRQPSIWIKLFGIRVCGIKSILKSLNLRGKVSPSHGT